MPAYPPAEEKEAGVTLGRVISAVVLEPPLKPFKLQADDVTLPVNVISPSDANVSKGVKQPTHNINLLNIFMNVFQN